MKKQEFVRWVSQYENSIAFWKIEIEELAEGECTIGCYYSGEKKSWIVYLNDDRGKHRVRLETENEEKAYDKLKSMVETQMENSKGYI